MAVAYNTVPKADLKCHTWVHQTLANSTRKDHLITPAFPMDNLFVDLWRLVCTQLHALSCRQVIQVHVQAGQPPPLQQNDRKRDCLHELTWEGSSLLRRRPALTVKRPVKLAGQSSFTLTLPLA